MDYQFRPLGKKCAATGADLVPGSVCHSVLLEQDGEITRLDYSDEAWTGPPPGTIAVWLCVIPKPVEVRRNLFEPQTLMRYFEQLTEEAQPAQEKLRYILALLLLQKRLLRLDGSRLDSTAGGEDEYLQLSGTHGEGQYEVQDLHLADTEMHELQAELNARLAAEWGEAA